MSRPRISRRDLDATVRLLNEITGNPTEPYRLTESGQWVPNPGAYLLSGAYGGWSLHQMAPGGGERDVLSSGHIPARELYERMHAYRYGLEAARVQQAAR